MRATYRHPRAVQYRRPGGPWDVPALEVGLRVPTSHDVVLVDGSVRLSPAELTERIDRLAGGLRTRGVRRGDVVAWQTPNWHESVLLLRACWQLGAVAAPILHRAGRRDLEPMLDVVRPRLMLAGPDLPLADRPGAVAVRGNDDEFAELASGSPPVTVTAAQPADLALVMFTSGTSGRPKAVLHTHRTLMAKARSQGVAHGLTGHHTVLVPAPLGHVAGVLNGVTFPGLHGMKTVLVDRWDPEVALRLTAEEAVNYLGCPVAFLQGMVDAPGFRPDLVASLQVVSIGGSSMTPAQLGELGEALGCQVKRSYGSTEAPTITTTCAGDDPALGWSTDGRVASEADLRVVDPDTRRQVPAGVAGEVWVQGPELFVGYADPADTAAAVHRGWFRTGDLGRLDDAGFLTIVGRLKDLIIRGGENIPNAEVEIVLEQHPAVRQAAVVGYPDPVLGERVAACLVLNDPFDLEACRRWFAEQGVARYKTPERIVTLDALPLLGTGKPDRAALKALVVARHSGDGGEPS